MLLTGGFYGSCSELTSSYCIHEDQWKSEPDLKIARLKHSSCILGERIFVLGGEHEVSVESLKVGAAQLWEIIATSSQFGERRYPALAKLNQHQIVCFGGRRNLSYLSDGYVLDSRDNSVKMIKESRDDIKLHCTG